MKYIWTNSIPFVSPKNPIRRSFQNLKRYHALINTKVWIGKTRLNEDGKRFNTHRIYCLNLAVKCRKNYYKITKTFIFKALHMINHLFGKLLTPFFLIKARLSIFSWKFFNSRQKKELLESFTNVFTEPISKLKRIIEQIIERRSYQGPDNKSNRAIQEPPSYCA